MQADLPRDSHHTAAQFLALSPGMEWACGRIYLGQKKLDRIIDWNY